MLKGTIDAFVEAQQSIVNEINYARNELIVGRYEEVYNILTNLSDELTKDIQISTEEYEKKELNIESANENV